MSPDQALSDVASGEFHKDRVSRVLLIIGIVLILAAVIMSIVALIQIHTQHSRCVKEAAVSQAWKQ